MNDNNIFLLNQRYFSYPLTHDLGPSSETVWESLSFQRVRVAIISNPQSLELSEAEFARQCKVSIETLRNIFKKVLVDRKFTAEFQLYPEVYFKQCNKIISTFSTSGNYIERIVYKHAIRASETIKRGLVPRFKHFPKQHVTSSPFVARTPKNYPISDYLNTYDPLDGLLALLQVDETFTMSLGDICSKISIMTEQPFSTVDLTQYLEFMFPGEKGNLWPEKKLKVCQNGLAYHSQYPDPYSLEMMIFFDGLRIEIIETVRAQFLAFYQKYKTQMPQRLIVPITPAPATRRYHNQET